MPTYILNEEKMFSDIADGVAIVINSETGIYYGMNGFGTAVFEQLLNGADTEAVLAALMALPGAPADMETRFAAFLDKMLACGILIAGETADGDVNLSESVADADAFELAVEEFDDAQEMLLADPIHEVKEDQGWQADKDALETDAAVVKEKETKMRN